MYTDGNFYYVCSDWNEESSYYIGTLPKENWAQAREILQNSPSVDERKRAAESPPLEDPTNTPSVDSQQQPARDAMPEVPDAEPTPSGNLDTDDEKDA